MISRRHFLVISTLFSFRFAVSPLDGLASTHGKRYSADQYPLTIEALKDMYRAEKTASICYEAYCQQALFENYPNIAYLFSALSTSEKIHAYNFQQLTTFFDIVLKKVEIETLAKTTRTNLNQAAVNELEKINTFYPDILRRLTPESHDQTVIYSMYSWKSHQQHEKMIKDIKTYSGLFFKPLAKKIEGMNPNYYVCEICGSTIDEKPLTPCDICNYSMGHYKRLQRPVTR